MIPALKTAARAAQAVLVLAAVAAVFRAATSSGLAAVAWLGVMFAVIAGAVPGVTALQPKGGARDERSG